MIGWVLLATFLAVGIFIALAHSKGQQATETAADVKLESDLELARSRAKASQVAPTWTAPKLPPSVIASIWTSRLSSSSAQLGDSSKRDPTASLRFMTWNYSRKAPYILAAAFLSLRDTGLVRLLVEPHGHLLDPNTRVRVERTDMALTGLELPAIEGGLLLACLDMANKRFGKTTLPSANAVVNEWIHESKSHAFKWVLEYAAQQGQALGLYEPVIKKTGLGKFVGSSPLVFSLDHLAACDDQVVAYVARWHEIAVSEPELQRTLLTEVAFGIYTRQQQSA